MRRTILDDLKKADVPLVPDLREVLFPDGYELLPTVRQRYEYELALGEALHLSKEELIKRGAYFARIDGEETYHYRICSVMPLQVSPDASEERKRFFEHERFSVAYATHGLFPYRGKFHPQMIKAIMNVIGLRPGDVVLDPMVGSGTTQVEACIMGIDSVGVELNPFTVFMTKAKLEALDVDTSSFPDLLRSAHRIFDFFNRRAAIKRALSDVNCSLETFVPSEESVDLIDDERIHDLLLLCYLDALGYARRRKRKTARELFPQLLKRYLEAVEAFNKIRAELGLKLGSWHVIWGDARHLPFKDGYFDGIVFSPPYSFALDYLENDRVQLEYLGIDVDSLKRHMIGLRGDSVNAKLALYFKDMRTFFSECYRVLKPGKFCVMVIGSNTAQTGGVRLEEPLARIAKECGFEIARWMTREIVGIRHTMKEEHIIFFRKAR